MSKKPILKNNKEVNPLLKSLNIEKMNSAQIEQEISKEEKLLNNFISHYKYPEAEICDKKISELKKILKKKKIKEVNQRHTAEKEHLKIDEFSDMNNLKFYWDKKFQELQSKSQAALEELKKTHEMEYQALISQKDMNINLRPSSAFLKYQKEEEGLVKLRKFKEAAVIRKKKEEQRKKDMNRIGKNNENSMKMLEKKLRIKQNNELKYLQNKFQLEFDELTKERQRQVEFTNKKYSVKNKDLINQQKRENNVNKFNNYGKRIKQLHNNYEQKFIIGQKEYKPQNQVEKFERLYAELQDNKIEGMVAESNLENNNENLNDVKKNGMEEENEDFSRQQEILQKEINKNEEDGN